jgi:predicted dehydrogenase
MSKLRVGLIGANVGYGWSPIAHLPALAELPEFELAAVCTAHEATARESAAKYGARLAFHDHREMLARDDIDIVGIVVRVPNHHQLTMDALEAGKHVYTEWPLGANLREAEEMADLARKKSVHTMAGLQSRAWPDVLRLKELVDEGYLGEVLAVNLSAFFSGILSRTSARTWQKDVELGATSMTIGFGHVIDALCMIFGEFSEVASVVKTQVPQWHETDTGNTVDVTSPDNILVSGTLTSGAVVSAHFGTIPWHNRPYRLQAYGREGTLVVDTDETSAQSTTRIYGGKSDDAGLTKIAVPSRLTWVPESVPQGPPFNVAQMWRRFGEAIRSGERAEPDFDTAVVRHRLLDAIQRASDTGQRQSL